MKKNYIREDFSGKIKEIVQIIVNKTETCCNNGKRSMKINYLWVCSRRNTINQCATH